MIYVGIDDTDTLDDPGTNQLARHLVRELTGQFNGRMILRHQLLEDPRVPCTKKNGCASILFDSPTSESQSSDQSPGVSTSASEQLIDRLRDLIIPWCPAGSDPGFCVAEKVPTAVAEWGLRCQRDLVTKEEARRVAAEDGIHLEGLGGTEDGIIGALAAVGLMATKNDGRVIFFGASREDWYDVTGCLTVEDILARGVDEILTTDNGRSLAAGTVDVGKRLRPNFRNGRVVLYVCRGDLPHWEAVRAITRDQAAGTYASAVSARRTAADYNASMPAYCHPAAFAAFEIELPRIETTPGLFRAAFAIAQHELPNVEVSRSESAIAELAQTVRRRVHSTSIEAKLAHLHDVLFDVVGFAGNVEDYYNPANSYLPEVLRVHRGLPITLVLVYKCVAEQVGLTVRGINSPGHFLAAVESTTLSQPALPGECWMYVDPFFGGELLNEADVRRRVEATTGRAVADASQWLVPATHKQWLARMLNNLQAVFAHTGRERDLFAMQELQELLK